MNEQQAEQLIENTTTLLGQFSVMVKGISDESLRNINELKVQLQTTKNDVAGLMRDSQTEIRKETKKSITEALETQAKDFEKRLKLALSEVEDSIHSLHKERKAIAAQTRILSWKAVIGIAVGMAIMLIASFSMTWNEKQKRDVMIEEYKAAKVQAQATNAENRMIKTQCGDHLCIKIDKAAGNWGKEGEYAVPILK